jgi:glycosyltransferase involved in cell wall biosynthesis
LAKRLLQIARTLPWQIAGGMETHAWELSRALFQRGWTVDIVTSALDGRERIETRNGIRIHYVSYLPDPRPKAQWRWWLHFAPAVRRYVKGLGLEFDVAHSESVYGHELFRDLSGSQTPSFMTLHGTHLLQYREAGRPDMLRRHPWYHPRAVGQALFIAAQRRKDRRQVLPAPDALIAVSERVADHLVKDYRQARDRIHVIPNGISEVPTMSAPRGSQRGVRNILYLGRLAPSKRVDRLLEHARAHPADHVTIAGDGDDAPRLKRLAAELVAKGQVRFLGHVDEATKWRLLQEADVFALPSDSEGQPISIVEALAAGTPVYARGDWTPRSLRELVAVDEDLRAGLASAIALGSRVKEARGKILKEFSWDAIAARYERLFAGLVTR